LVRETESLVDPAAVARRIPTSTLVFRWATVAVALFLLLVQLPALASAPASTLVALVLTFVAVRAIPVATAREKSITFCSAFVFAGALLAGGAAAGLAAMVACSVHAWLFQRGGRPYAVFLGAQLSLAAMAAQGAFYLVSGHPLVLATGATDDFGAIGIAAATFIAVNGALVATGNLGTRYARRAYAEPALRIHALGYAVSFPYAALVLLAYGAYGAKAIPILAAFLLICAHSVRVTVENRSMRRALKLVADLGDRCASEIREEAPLERFLQVARDLVSFDHAILWFKADAPGNLQPRVVFPAGTLIPDYSEASLNANLNRVAGRKQPLIVAQAQLGDEPAGGLVDSVPESDESWILYPILLNGESIGVVQLVRSARRPFSRVDMGRLASLVPQAAIAFEGARVRYLMHQYQEMMERYQGMAQTDGLTGLFNHRRSQELLHDEAVRSARYHRPLSVLMVDIDSFKQYNDAYGHPTGDGLLRSISRILTESVRATDHVGRYGGEEFVVILPETTGSDAQLLAERLRAAVEAAWFAAGEGYVIQKTVSIGVAAFPRDATTAAELLRQVDAALYRAKTCGKNRVEMADRSPVTPWLHESSPR
jgi:diguanylate cyclase (GGDEF)-like protein